MNPLGHTRGWDATVHLPDGALPDWVQGLVAIAVVLLALGPLAMVRMRGRWKASSVMLGIKATHLLPAVIQVCIFTYWGLYWRGLKTYIAAIAVEVLFGYVLDGMLSLIVRRKWVIAAGPLPIVLSTNLFVLFLPGEAYLTLFAITIAMLSKAFIRTAGKDGRGGRHIMNPSALGISVMGIATLAWPALGYGDSAYEFSVPPNMAEVILLLALVVQTRIPIVLVSAAAVFGLHVWAHFSGELMFSPYWAPVTLVLVLLITDPATIPRTAWGRLLYGFAVGIGIQIAGLALKHIFGMDNYAKVVGIPLANALVPLFERFATKLPRFAPIEARYNLLHMALWMAWMTSQLLGTAKPPGFESMHGAHVVHRINHTPFVKFTKDGALTCKDNPMFCRGFSFHLEAKAWLDKAK